VKFGDRKRGAYLLLRLTEEEEERRVGREGSDCKTDRKKSRKLNMEKQDDILHP
jgi:hypothetical protein